MFEEVMRVGPKGQVVIPASLRQAMKIGPGSEIIFRMEKDKVIIDIPKIEDPIQTLESIALKGKSVSKIDIHSYHDEIESRHE
jgi:AbrB family looped-hinge helix DNA binding protein